MINACPCRGSIAFGSNGFPLLDSMTRRDAVLCDHTSDQDLDLSYNQIYKQWINYV